MTAGVVYDHNHLNVRSCNTMVEVHINDTCLVCGVASMLALCDQCAAKALVKQVVKEKQGCKAVELVTFVAMEMAKSPSTSDIDVDLPELIETMTKEGELVEVEYVLPNMDYRVKSFLLPKGTEIL